jgi:hypothetical protein
MYCATIVTPEYSETYMSEDDIIPDRPFRPNTLNTAVFLLSSVMQVCAHIMYTYNALYCK